MPSQTLDARGLFCPEPVMLLHKTIKDVEVGEVLQVLATDPATERDIAKFCRFLGHELISTVEQDKEYHFLLRKNASA